MLNLYFVRIGKHSVENISEMILVREIRGRPSQNQDRAGQPQQREQEAQGQVAERRPGVRFTPTTNTFYSTAGRPFLKFRTVKTLNTTLFCLAPPREYSFKDNCLGPSSRWICMFLIN